jgi:RimJ/RimL family protein N-acetyltransferase
MPGPAFLVGDRVSLRTIEEEDLDFLHTHINDPAVWRGIDRSRPVTLDAEREFLEGVRNAADAVHLLVAAESTPLGVVSFDPIDWQARVAELGYWIAPDHQGEGYGTDAVELFVAYGFDQLGLHKLSATVYAFNDPSIRLLERLGFVREGTDRDAVFVDGERHDTHWYGLLAREWRAAREK